MKKMLVLALVTMAFAGQAHAGPGERAKEIRAREAREVELRSKVLSRTSPAVTEVANKVSAANLDKALSPMEAKTLAFNLSKGNNADLVKVANEIVAQSKAKPALAELGKARIEGLLNVSKLPSSVRNTEANLGLPEQKAQQAYVALVLNAGKQASNWTPEVEKHMELFLKTANLELSRGKSYDAAMNEAKLELKRVAKKDINIDEIKRLCKDA